MKVVDVCYLRSSKSPHGDTRWAYQGAHFFLVREEFMWMVSNVRFIYMCQHDGVVSPIIHEIDWRAP